VTSPDQVFAAAWGQVRRDPSDREAWTAFVGLMARTRFTSEADNTMLLNVLLACLAQEDLDAQPLADTTLHLFRRDPLLAPLLATADLDDPGPLREAVAMADLHAVFGRNVVKLALTRLILPSMSAERIFAEVRRTFVAAVAGGGAADAGIACALGRQCFLNGYVWPFEQDEVAAVEAIADSLHGRDLDSKDVPAICLLGAYVPLWSWERAEDVVDLAVRLADPWFAGLVRHQVAHPLEESMIREGIPTLALSDDRVSAEVRGQYEEHPYPRWSAVNVQPYDTVAGALRAAIQDPDAPCGVTTPQPAILVAGCGTGRQLAQVAMRFTGAVVTGVDLSLSSLSYAVRRCHELRLDRVTVAHADILALEGWDESFDIVECGGVLHHMDRPAEGWRVLRTLLRPGGLMRIALYSAAARTAVLKARDHIAHAGFPPTPEGIRDARGPLARHFSTAAPELLRSLDFYSMEECRDLLFHVQEHHFTLPDVEALLADLSLDFLGFEFADTGTLPSFRERFPGPGMPRSLAAWHTYEQENPHTFRGMYQFWVADGRR
jgi:SAM-dependent methyltransferase